VEESAGEPLGSSPDDDLTADVTRKEHPNRPVPASAPEARTADGAARQHLV
jgi:hypothetical protein